MHEIVPLQGVGPFQLGMPEAAAMTVMYSLGKPQWLCLGGVFQVWQRPDGPTFTPRFGPDESPDRVLESISVEGWYDEGSKDRVVLHGVDIFTTPRDDVLRELSRHDRVVDFGNGVYRAVNLGLRLQTDKDDRGPFKDVEIAMPDREDIGEFQRGAMLDGVLWMDPLKTAPR